MAAPRIAPVGIMCATRSEAAPFLAAMEDASLGKLALFEFHKGTFGGKPAVVVCSGVCKGNASMVAQILISHFGVQAVVNAGTAGALDPAVGLFDVVVGTRFEHHDMVFPDEFLMNSYPFYPDSGFNANEALVAAARAAASQWEGAVHFGKMATGEQFVTDERRADVVAACAPLSVDMESAAMAQVCFANDDTPFISVRSMTDTASHDAEASYEENRERASQVACDFTRALLAELDLGL